MRQFERLTAGLFLACGIGSTACGSDDATLVKSPVAIVGVYEDVKAYPACGNETLDHEGVTWYPVMHSGYPPMDSSLQDLADEILAVERDDPPDALFQSFAPRVPSPGAGDDIGTLVVWADGVARWVSDSGVLDVWMIDDEITYTWVC